MSSPVSVVVPTIARTRLTLERPESGLEACVVDTKRLAVPHAFVIFRNAASVSMLESGSDGCVRLSAPDSELTLTAEFGAQRGEAKVTPSTRRTLVELQPAAKISGTIQRNSNTQSPVVLRVQTDADLPGSGVECTIMGDSFVMDVPAGVWTLAATVAGASTQVQYHLAPQEVRELSLQL